MASNGVKGSEGQQWNIGLINPQGKYLTAETFGFEINATGTTLKKKQVWTIEHEVESENGIYIKSHLGRYVACDKLGAVTCNSESPGSACMFTIIYEDQTSDVNNGKLALRSEEFGTYLGGTSENLACNMKQEWWMIQLAVHPQVNLKNANRKTYACYAPHKADKDTDEAIEAKSKIPWGKEAIITLEFADGKYFLKSCNNRYLDREGHLVEERNNDCMYTLQICFGQISGMALKDCTGRFLSGVGINFIMQGRNTTVGKDERFTLEECNPQVLFVAHNNKKVSIKQGVELSANEDAPDVTCHETFQLEFDKPSHQWRLRTYQDKYWSLEADSGIQDVGDAKSEKGLFSLEYLDGGSIALKASNGRYLTAKKDGSLYATPSSITEKERFTMTILNRPILIIMCEFGFWGFKTTGNAIIECNKANYEIMILEHTWGKEGVYFIKTHLQQDGKPCKYLDIDNESNLVASSDTPKPFIFELIGQSRMFIKAPNGQYLTGEMSGILVANVSEKSKATPWQY